MTTDVKALAKAGVQDAVTNTGIVRHNETAETIAQTFQKILPKLAQASLAKLPPEFIVSTAMTVIRNSEQLRECDPLSVVHCVIQSAQTGLRLDPVLQQAALVPRYNSRKNRKEAQFMPMYKGLLLLSRRSGKIVHVAAQPVYSNDKFEYEYGSEQRLVHKPELGKDRGTITHYYAYIKLASGGFQFEVMTQVEVDEVKEFALADKKNIKDSPWTTDPIPMSLKTVLRRLLKLAPVEDPMLMAAIQSDEMLERGVLQEQIIQGGLVVPGGAYQDDDPTERPAATVQEAVARTEPVVHVDTAKTVDESGGVDPNHPLNKKEPVTKEEGEMDMDPDNKLKTALWVKVCVAVFPFLAKKSDKEKAKSWGREAHKRFEAGFIGGDDYEKIKLAYIKAFPDPAQLPLFNSSGEVVSDAVASTVHAPAKAAVESAKGDDNDNGVPASTHKKREKKPLPVSSKPPISDTHRDEWLKKIDEAKKLAPLFSMKNSIEKDREMMHEDTVVVLAALDEKFTALKAKTTK